MAGKSTGLNTEKGKRGLKIPDSKWAKYAMLHHGAGMSKRQAAMQAGISYSAVMKAQREPSYAPQLRRAAEAIKESSPEPARAKGDLSEEAARALDDFAYFRLRYFGIYSTPWQVDAAEEVRAHLETDDKEYVVINVPPGAGKSTLFTFHIVCWLICRNRAVRIMIGSATERTARAYGGRVRRALERTQPIKNPSEQVEAGLMADAEACLVDDFGAFKPENRDLWRSEEFRVEQTNGQASEEKEATVATFGRDGGFLGGRYDFVIWDDLVTKKNQRIPDSRQAMQEWFDDEAETRLEPGGLFVLQGQRLQGTDLYRYALNKPGMDDEPGSRKYRHIIYKSHYPEHCKGQHGKDAPAYDPRRPDDSGCLLDPARLSWRQLALTMANKLQSFLVVYQQEDLDPADVLVPALWVAGGRDPETGEEFPGCWDPDRSVGRVPKGLAPPWLRVVSADPSPTKFWSVQEWIFHPKTGQRFLIDLHRHPMRAPDFLDYSQNTDAYVGLLEEWWQRAHKQGAPFRHVVVEQNAAQRFLLQYDHVQRWCALRGVQIIGHETHANKTDENFGVGTVAPHWRYGRVRLPGAQTGDSRVKSLKLVGEVTTWPESNTDDCVMAHWFAEYVWQKQLSRAMARPKTPPQMPRPSWLKAV